MRTRTEQDDRPADTDDEIVSFIVEYPTAESGSATARDIIKVGRSAGFTEAAITKARFRARAPKIDSKRIGFGKGSSENP